MAVIFKKPFYILKNNLIFIQPLLLCLLIMITAAAFIVNRNIYLIPRIILIISMILLLIAFSAGWFYINKYAVLEYDENDEKEKITEKAVLNFKKYFEGIGAGFLRVLFSYLILLVFYIIVMFGVYKLCLAIFGEPKIISEFPKFANAASEAELRNMINNIGADDKIIFSSWVMVINTVFSLVNFFCILYFTVVTFEKTNIIKSFWTAVKFFFRNIGGGILIVLFMFFLYMIFNALSFVFGVNSFSFVILIILYTMYLNYYLLLVFCFYNDKTKTNCNNRTELIG